MTNETMKDGERAALAAIHEFLNIALKRAYPQPDKPHSDWAKLRAAIDALAILEDRAASPQSGEKGDEPVAYEFQHDETSRTTYVDPWQVEQGFAANNPRWQLIGPVYRHARAAAPQAALTDEQRMAINTALGYLPVASDDCMRARITLRALLTQAPTERSDSAEGTATIKDL